MHEVYVAAAGRSAIGGFNGALAELSAVEMGSQVIRQLLARHTIDSALVDEVILGHVLSAGCGQNTARQASIRAGIGVMTPAMTINKVCGSGLKAVHLGAQAPNPLRNQAASHLQCQAPSPLRNQAASHLQCQAPSPLRYPAASHWQCQLQCQVRKPLPNPAVCRHQSHQ